MPTSPSEPSRSSDADCFAEVPEGLRALLDPPPTSQEDRDRIIEAKERSFELTTGCEPTDHDRQCCSIRRDDTVTEYDRSTSDPDRQRVAVHHRRERASTPVMHAPLSFAASHTRPAPRARASRPRAAARASSRGGDSGDSGSSEGDGEPPPPDPQDHLGHGPGHADCGHPLVWVRGELVCAIVGCPVERFARHAKRFGTECVFETAVEELEARDLGRLSQHLRRIDPKFRLPNDQRRALALALLEDGVDRKNVCWQTGASRSTLRRWRQELLESQPAAENGLANPGDNGARMVQNGGVA
jgi:hypothetical protein